MRWPVRHKTNHRNFWHPWFAWFPVEIGSEWVWFECVERRVTLEAGFDGHYEFVEYRLPAGAKPGEFA